MAESSGYSLRSDECIWLLGNYVTSFTSHKIPTKGEVLRYFCYLKDGPMKHEKHVYFNGAVAEKLRTEIQIQWEKAGIVTQRKDKVKLKILNLYDEYRKLQKNKGSTSNQKKETKFLFDLDSYFFVAHSDAERKIMNDRLRSAEKQAEDVAFLDALRSGTKVSLGSEDKAYKKQVINREMRAQAFQNRKQTEMTRQFEASATAVSEPYDNVSDDEQPGSSFDPDFQLPVSEVKMSDKKRSIDLSLPKNPFNSRKISEMADRLNLSLGQRTAFMASVISEGGTDLDDATLSKNSSRRAAKKIRTEEAADTRKQFVVPDFVTLHWDGKIVPGDHERLGILVAGAPNFTEGKLLGVPVIPDGTGTTQAKASFTLAKDWKVENAVVGLVFDTTASNSGWKSGACVQLEGLLDKKVFYFACRHHIMERILCAAWQELFGPTSSPDNPEFKELKTSWKSLADKSHFKTLNLSDRRLKHLRTENIEFIQNQLTSTSPDGKMDSLPRDDYRECAELMLILLGVEPPRGTHWMQPGAYHHARWMATIIYSAKMYAFGEQLGYDQAKMEKLKRICVFNALFYVRYWLSAVRCADAPANDLQFNAEMNQFKKIDPDLAKAVLTVLNRHMWYLTEEAVPLALFSSRVPDTEKKRIALQILKMKAGDALTRGVPIFPQLKPSTKLTHLIGKNSQLIFDLLGISYDWLSLPPASWPFQEAYQKAFLFVHNAKVVNDLAERAVKLITDFVAITRNEEQRQCVLQVVEAHRRKVPDFRKETLKKI